MQVAHPIHMHGRQFRVVDRTGGRATNTPRAGIVDAGWTDTVLVLPGETVGEHMKPLPHEYDVHLIGGPSGYAVLTTPGIPDLRTAPPSDFDGPGDAWSPEHLLLAVAGGRV